MTADTMLEVKPQAEKLLESVDSLACDDQRGIEDCLEIY